MIGRLAEDADAVTAGTGLMYLRSPPRYDHIVLKRIYIEDVRLFVEAIIEYQVAHKFKLPVTTMLSPRVREEILSKYRQLTLTKFYQLSTEEILQILQLECRPTTTLSFYEMMRKHLKFELPSGYKPYTANFKIFYDELIAYKYRTLQYFELMSEDNASAIPPILNREGGLIKLWADKIPFDYGQRVCKTVTKQVPTFRDFYEFLHHFYGVAASHYRMYEESKRLEEHFIKSSNEPGKDSATSSNHNKKVAAYKAAKNRIFNPARRPSSFHNMEDVPESYPFDDDPSDTMFFNSDFVTDDSLEAASPDPDPDDSVDPPPEDPPDDPGQFDSDADSVGEQLDELMYMAPNSAPSRPSHQRPPPVSDVRGKPLPRSNGNNTASAKPNGCFHLLFTGSCQKGDKCSYSHDSNRLQQTHAYYLKQLLSSKYKAPPPSNNHRPSVQKFSLVEDALLSPEHLQLLLDSSADLMPTPPVELPDTLLQQLYYSSVPEASLFTAMFRPAVLHPPDAPPLDVPRVLFDTGALHASYMSEEFFRKHKALLAPLQIGKKGCVKLADNKTFVNTASTVTLPISFKDASNVEHKAIVEFTIFPSTGSNDIIIGLPAIVQSFSALHKHMIDVAVNKVFSTTPESTPTLLNNLIHSPWNTLDDTAVEDLETPLPSSFPDVLYFMEMSYEEAVQEFLGQFDKHIAPEFRAATPIEELLRTKGVAVFVPQNWEGINGIPPFELEFKPGLPSRVKPAARAVNPKLLPAAQKEFERLCKYFYTPSNSAVASCLVIAPKATAPFIRFCGDYVFINKFIIIGHFPIPDVIRSLAKIAKFVIFIDFDLVNAFHQIRLGLITSAILSIQTPWGQFQPLFMPEGIGPASFKLQAVVYDIFKDFDDWTIVIYDNLLVLATDYDDAYRKCELILDRCIERNVFLKFSKTWMGFPEANFFGYVCNKHGYRLSDDRKNALNEVPFPKSIKQMQSFLGSALFFKAFIPHFSTLTAPLHDMTHKNFNWDPEAWTVNYRQSFDDLKLALINATMLHFPDYNLVWILRTDASTYGIGAVLLQVCPSADDSTEPIYQPIAYVSKKFSPQATKWSTIEQEAYAIYFSVNHFDYYLRCKPFILETDHNNLLWMESSTVPKIVRWRVLLQSFSFSLRHIAGTRNVVADWLSRVHSDDETPTSLSTMYSSPSPSPFLSPLPEVSSSQQDDVADDETVDLPAPITVEEALQSVHAGRFLHPGIRRTWLNLNNLYPGHRIPYKVVADYVASCAICQKTRLTMADSLQPLVRHLKAPHPRTIIGVDTLTVTPTDKSGNSYIIVVVNLFTKLVGLYPVAKHDAASTASAIFQYFCTYGLVSNIITDPGTEFANEILSHLTSWLGLRHFFSLVDRHESNGVESTNGQILRLLRALVFDERLVNQWSSPTVLPLIQYHLNSLQHSESGESPFALTFGTLDADFFALPDVANPDGIRLPSYISCLNDNLRVIREISQKFQQQLAHERSQETPPSQQNQYQPGDLVLFRVDTDKPLPSKLSPRYLGPYEVIVQRNNDVECKHIIMGSVHAFHVTRLKMFYGTYDDAKRVAMLDHDQYTIDRILAYRGDPNKRSTMEFEIAFQDGSINWLPYDTRDLFTTVPYEEFCRSKPELQLLLFPAKEATAMLKSWSREPITLVSPGDTCHVDLRSYGAAWYATLPLPDKDHVTYVLAYIYGDYVHPRHRKRIWAICPIFNERFSVGNDFIRQYGSNANLVPNGTSIILVDGPLLRKYPQLLPTHPT